jgi:hypothetical protein
MAKKKAVATLKEGAPCRWCGQVSRGGQKTRWADSDSDEISGITLALSGLWWDAKGDWKRAHESAQQDEGRDGSWVHAYLHRKEGDQGNAAYWYSRAGRTVSPESLDAEWVSIVRALLK